MTEHPPTPAEKAEAEIERMLAYFADKVELAGEAGAAARAMVALVPAVTRALAAENARQSQPIDVLKAYELALANVLLDVIDGASDPEDRASNLDRFLFNLAQTVRSRFVQVYGPEQAAALFPRITGLPS